MNWINKNDFKLTIAKSIAFIIRVIKAHFAIFSNNLK